MTIQLSTTEPFSFILASDWFLFLVSISYSQYIKGVIWISACQNNFFPRPRTRTMVTQWKIWNIVLHLTAPRGRVLKKCSDHYLKNQYSDFDVHTIERIFGIRSKEVVGENLIEGRIKKLWPKMSFFPWFFPDGVQWKLDILRQNNFHKKSNTTFGLEGLHLVVKASNLIFVQSRLR